MNCEWVADILQRFTVLGHLKPGERYQSNPAQAERRMNSAASVIALDGSICRGRPLFNRTLTNYGNTSFFNALLQMLASIPSFVEQILETLLMPDHADSSYCLAFLKRFIPAIASPSADPCRVFQA